MQPDKKNVIFFEQKKVSMLGGIIGDRGQLAAFLGGAAVVGSENVN